MLGGWLWDLALGGGRAHALAWLAALVLVGGISALIAASGRPGSRDPDADKQRKPAAQAHGCRTRPQADPVPRIRPAVPVEYRR